MLPIIPVVIEITNFLMFTKNLVNSDFSFIDNIDIVKLIRKRFPANELAAWQLIDAIGTSWADDNGLANTFADDDNGTAEAAVDKKGFGLQGHGDAAPCA